MKRRHFVAASAAAAGAAAEEPKRQLKTGHWGPAFYGEAEQKELTDVVAGRNPFRFYAGPNSKVLAFERAVTAYMGTKYALGVTCGTAALKVAAAALGMGTGIFFALKGKTERDRFVTALKAEGGPAGAPGGSVILPLMPHIQKKVTVHPEWPSFNAPRGKAILYGPETCPKTIAILNRFGGPLMDAKYTKADADYIVAAIRKVLI